MAKVLNRMVGIMVLVICMVVMMIHHAEGITCRTVVNSLMACKTYLTKGGSLPVACCSGVRSLNNAAKGTAARQTACNCIKVAAKALRINEKYAATVPAKCKVNIGYPISFTTDCNKVR